MSRPRSHEHLKKRIRILVLYVRGVPLKAAARREKVSPRYARRVVQQIYLHI